MRRASPRTVLGMPAYNRPDALPRVLESLLSQTCQDFAVLIVDDAPSEDVRKIVDSYAAYGPAITYETQSGSPRDDRELAQGVRAKPRTVSHE